MKVEEMEEVDDDQVRVRKRINFRNEEVEKM